MAAAGLPDSGSDNPAVRREAQQLLGTPGRRGHAGRELRVRADRVHRDVGLPGQPAQQGPAPVLLDTGRRLQGEHRAAARPAVGSLICIFAVGYMANAPERRRFFGYMNLFLAAMLLLVLADNYLGLYAG